MNLELRKEHFSYAYVRAIASAAGYGVTRPEVDDDSVDLQISGRTPEDAPRRPRVDLQVKCTSTEVLRGDQVVYPLKRKNYDELKITDVIVPRLLVVVRVPDNDEEWVRHSEAELAIRHCGYWVSIAGHPDMANTSTISIAIPRSNLFDVAGLRALMQRVADREQL